MGTKTVEAKQRLDKRYGDFVPAKSTIIDWYTEFKCNRINTDDTERSGLPKSAVVPENRTKFHKIVLGDRKLKLHDIADALKISEGSVLTILHESLEICKLFLAWVPRLLTPDQKQQRVEDSERCFELFKRGRKDLLRRHVTMDEICIHHCTPETKRSSAEWTEAGERSPKRPKTQQWAGKVMLSVCWDVHGILFIDYLDIGKTIDSDYYLVSLDRLSAEIKRKGHQMRKKESLFHQDNAPCHNSMETMVKLDELSFELLPHPPFPPDLAPSDY